MGAVGLLNFIEFISIALEKDQDMGSIGANGRSQGLVVLGSEENGDTLVPPHDSQLGDHINLVFVGDIIRDHIIKDHEGSELRKFFLENGDGLILLHDMFLTVGGMDEFLINPLAEKMIPFIIIIDGLAVDDNEIEKEGADLVDHQIHHAVTFSSVPGSHSQEEEGMSGE